jgi:hypothetical protein
MTATLTRDLPQHAPARSGHASIFQRALGADYARMHPTMQRRFGLVNGEACVGTGVMDEIWRGSALAVPFLHLGTRRHILFPETGRDVPFTIENYAYADSFGRDTVTFVRTFQIPAGPARRFDATMVFDPGRRVVVDFLGTHQHLAVDLDVQVGDDGGIRIRSGQQRLREGFLGFRFPARLTGSAQLHEWYDDATGEYRIDVAVVNPLLGPLFGYRGRFWAEFTTASPAQIPGHVRPLRENPVGW